MHRKRERRSIGFVATKKTRRRGKIAKLPVVATPKTTTAVDLVRDEAVTMARELELHFRLLADEIASQPEHEGAFANVGEELANAYEIFIGRSRSEPYRKFFQVDQPPMPVMPPSTAWWRIPLHWIDLESKLSKATFPTGHPSAKINDTDRARNIVARIEGGDPSNDYALAELAKAVAAWRANHGKWEAAEAALSALNLGPVPQPNSLARQYREYNAQLSVASKPEK